MKNVWKHDHAFAIKMQVWVGDDGPRERTREEGLVVVREGQELNLRVQYENTDRHWRLHEKVKIVVNLPEQLEYVPGSTVMTNDTFADGRQLDDGIADGGVEIGDYAPGRGATVCLRAKAVAKNISQRELAVSPSAQGEVSCAEMQDFAQVVVVVRKT